MIKALWVRGLCFPVAFDRYISWNRQIFVTAVLSVLVELLSYASSPTPTDRGDSFMYPPWCRVWCYGRYATGWKMFSGNVVLDLISTCFIPRCSPVLTQTKPAAQHYKHVERAPSQLTHSLLILHSTSQHEQSPCCYETNFLSWNLQKMQSAGQQPAMWTTG